MYLGQQSGTKAQRDQALRHLEREGWLDDRACAKLVAAHRVRQGFAWAAIRAELLQRGIDGRLVDTVLRPLQRESDDRHRAEDIGRAHVKRLGKTARGSSRVTARGAGYLARRGFDESIVEDVVARVCSARAVDA